MLPNVYSMGDVLKMPRLTISIFMETNPFAKKPNPKMEGKPNRHS